LVKTLHHACAVAGLEHAGEVGLQVDRLRRRVRHRALDPTDDLLDRPEQARLDARVLEQLAHEEGRRGLAVGAGDAEHAQTGGRIAVEACRGGTHRRAHVRHLHLRHA